MACSTVRLIPGPQGLPGSDGTDGSDGANAYTLLADSFTMPAELASATATVQDSSWMTTGQVVYMEGAGWLEVTAVPDSASVTLKNLEDAATDAYAGNVAPATVIATGNKIVASGPQGPAGEDGTDGAPVDAAYLVATANGTLTNEVNLGALASGILEITVAAGTATVSIATDGTDYLSSTTGLTAAGNLSALASPATARTNLGLGTIATQAANNVAITGGAISGATGSFTTLAASTSLTNSGKLFAPSSAIQSLLAATAINPDATVVRVVGNGGAVTLTATPTITSPAADGQLLLIRGTDNTNTVTLQDEGSLAGTKLALGAATRALGAGDQIMLAWDATSALWYEVCFTNN